MTQEEKELVIIDISARLLYGVKVQINSDVKKVVGVKNGFVITKERGLFSTKEYITRIEYCRPYLRSMSSMTEEERKEYEGFIIHREHVNAQGQEWDIDCFSFDTAPRLIDWLNKNHFDYRGLIERGLALEVTEKNNPYE